MAKGDKLYLSHILDAISSIESYVDGLDSVAFADDPLRQDGVVRQLGIVGEAVKRLSTEIREINPQVPWRDITGMRDRLVHDYMGVNVESVWKTVQVDLPELRRAVSSILDSVVG